MKKNYYLGIDTAKNGMSYQLENERAEVLAKGYVRATLKAMHRFCELMEAKASHCKANRCFDRSDRNAASSLVRTSERQRLPGSGRKSSGQ